MPSATGFDPRSRALHLRLRHTWAMGPSRLPEFLETLLAFDLRRAYREFGFASLASYALVTLGCSYFQVQQMLRTARALGSLPLCELACRRGELPLPRLNLIAPMARPEIEEIWIERARKLSMEELRFEVCRAMLLERASRDLEVRVEHSGGHTSLLPPGLYA